MPQCPARSRCILTAALLLPASALAADPLPDPSISDTLEVTVAVDLAEEMMLTDAILGFYSDAGVLLGVCKTSAKTTALSGGESHWLSSSGETHWTCSWQGAADGDGVVVLASEEHVEAWEAVADGDALLLLTWDGEKVGVIRSTDGLTDFDLDGTEPTFLDGKHDAWLETARDTLIGG